MGEIQENLDLTTIDNRGELLLCLKCRSFGHKVANCPQPAFAVSETLSDDSVGSDWFLSPLRAKCRRQLAASSCSMSLCTRCTALDLTQWLATHPVVEQIEELDELCNDCWATGKLCSEKHARIFRDLGTVDSLELRIDCGMCRCLFDIIPNPSSGSERVTLALSWTLFRLEHHASFGPTEQHTSSKFVTAILEPQPDVHRIMTILGDGLVLAHDDMEDDNNVLGSSPVHPSKLNCEAIQSWLQTCTEKHQLRCSRVPTARLNSIRLIDTTTRTIIPYSSATLDYLALSYVWGQVDQTLPGAGIVGTRLPALSRTLEDAMTFTAQLGQRYVWIDSICINQSDPQDKQSQINIMHEIYQCAYATIIDFEGKDANDAIPRLLPNDSCPQMSCTVNDKVLRTIGPTLEHLVNESTWNSRAWTYQEAILSPRCIFPTSFGIYFECNSMTCCESLDFTSSPTHNALKDEIAHNSQTYSQRLNLGQLRNPVSTDLTDRGRALNVYSLLASMYNRREMTKATDALSAFSGILGALKDHVYPTGFFWALPLMELNWAMVWQAHYPDLPRNPHFPSWSWLSNKCGMWPGGPSIGRAGIGPDSCPFDMSLSAYESSYSLSPRTVFQQSYHNILPEYRDILVDDPLSEPFALESRGSLTLPPGLDELQTSKLLAFDSFALHFAVCNRWEEPGNVFHSLVQIKVAGEDLKGITTYDPKSQWNRAGKQIWLLLTRHIEEDEVLHNMILLEDKGWYYERKDMLRIEVPVDKVWVLSEMGLHRLRGLLM